jgi:hypothetical protein
LPKEQKAAQPMLRTDQLESGEQVSWWSSSD